MNVMQPIVKLTRIKIYNCRMCPKFFPSTDQVDKHYKTHKHTNSAFKCKDCDMWFQSNRECTQHEMSHIPRIDNSPVTEAITIKKEIKKEKTKTKKKLKSEPQFDLPPKNKDGRYTCPKCNKELKCPKNYKHHYYLQHCNKYVCRCCDRGFGTENMLIQHIKTHIDKIQRPYKCEICSKGFTQAGAAKIHKERVHDRILDKKCRYCRKAFYCRKALSIHIRTHTGYKPHKCDYCSKLFADRSAMNRHIRIHTGELRYSCPECPMKFSDASGLHAHRKRHSGIKRFQCNKCKKMFMDAVGLKTHMQSLHDNEKIHVCHQCGTQKKSKTLLKIHIKEVHRKNEGRYVCGVCNKNLATRKFLENHLYKIHQLTVTLEEKPKLSPKEDN